MKILIVEDEAAYRQMLHKLISGWGHRVVSVGEGGRALETAAQEDFDLMFLDVFLQDMTARELIPALKVLQPQAPIFTHTGMNSRELERELRELGIGYFMAKPVQREELERILDHLDKRCNRSRADAARARAAGA